MTAAFRHSAAAAPNGAAAVLFMKRRRSTTPQSSEAVTGLNEERPLLSRWTRPKRSSDIQRSFLSGAGGGARTRTVVTPRDFKTSTESRREKTYEEVNAKNPCDCKALNGNWRKLETPRKRAFFLEKSDSERKWRERAKSKQAFLPMTNSDDKRKRHEEKSCVLSKAVSGLS